MVDGQRLSTAPGAHRLVNSLIHTRNGSVETGFVKAPGARLYYEAAGRGHPLLLIHAGVADCRMWDALFPVFAQQFRVVRYDTRGFGKSLTEDVAFSNRQDVSDLLDHLGIERTYVIGVSRGGSIAIDFTLEHPERVAALIPVASGLGGFKSGSRPVQETQMFAEMDRLWEAKEFTRLADLEVRMWVSGPGQPPDRVALPVRERIREMILNNYTTHKVEGQSIVMEPPAAGRLGEIRVPTLVVLGDLDESGVLAAADEIVRGVAGARKVVVPGTAHMLSLEKPEEFTKIVLDFLQSLGV